MQDPTEPLSSPLSPLGQRLLKLDPQAYGKLVVEGDGDDGNVTARDLLQGVQASDLVAGTIARRDEANGLLAGLWLYFDWLDESHRISQSIDTPTGSFWHAIMHRREGDFGNSRYWYARCAGHPVLAAMAAAAGDVVHSMPADKSLFRLVASGWNPSAFVDLVEQVRDSGGGGRKDDPRRAVAVTLQRVEWQMLFNHCSRAAVGSVGSGGSVAS